jgi:hypothetical protein
MLAPSRERTRPTARATRARIQKLWEGVRDIGRQSVRAEHRFAGIYLTASAAILATCPSC